jgi:hypothetical protein
MDKSPIDDLFYSLYKFYPNKKGRAFELLVAAAIKIITGKKVDPDKHVKGEYSKTDYQIDGILYDDKGEVMIEAKDYTARDEKVGRDDLQTMQGALTELKFIKGVFASATDFTRPARKYAKATDENPVQKLIDLYHIRPSTEEDEKGRIKKIEITISMLIANYEQAQLQPAWTKQTIEEFKKDGLINKPISAKLDSFYNLDNSLFMTMREFTFNNQPVGEIYETLEANSCWVLTDKAIKINDKCYGIKGIEYKIPYTKSDTKFTVEVEGQPKILIKSDDGSIDKLLTDEQLRQVTFEE